MAAITTTFETGLPAVKPSQVEVNSCQYEAYYGRKPSGVGGWMFIDEEHEKLGNYYDFAFCHNGSFAEARKAAKAFYAPLGITLVSVLT